MKKKNKIVLVYPNKKTTCILNLSAIVVSVVSIVLLFLPFWTMDDGTSYSINRLVWFPLDNKPLQAWIKSAIDSNFTLNGFVGGPILMLVGGALTAFFSLLKRDSEWVCLPQLLVGIGSLVSLFTQPAIVNGASAIRMGLIVLFLVVTAIGVANLVLLVKVLIEKRRKFKEYR